MNWEAIGAIGEIVGAIAVLVTLIFLILLIQQNTIALQQQSFKESTSFSSKSSFMYRGWYYNN